MPSISASAYTPGAKFHKSSFVFPHIFWAQPLGMPRSNDWELGVKRHCADVSMSGSLARNLHIMYWLCHCQGEAANPRRINYRSLQFMHLDGWVVWSQCSCKPKIENQKCGFVFQQHNKSVKFHFTTTPMLMIPGSADPFFRGSVLMDSWLMFLVTAGRPAPAAAGRAGAANNE